MSTMSCLPATAFITLALLTTDLALSAKPLTTHQQQQPESRVQCYTCEADLVREPYQTDHPCLFPNDPKNMVTCSENSRFCQVDVTRVGGALLTLERRCVADCEEKCSEKGFGIVRKTCTYCCHDNPACAENGD